MAPIDDKFEFWRRELLDLSHRNRLLSFKPSKSGTIRLIEPDAATIYERLVRAEHSYTFFRAAPPNLAEAQPLLFRVPTEQARKSNEKQATEARRPLRKDEVRGEALDQDLDRLLYRIYLKARGSLLEQGVNILFVSFGMLNWAETPSSQIVNAPLVLTPVKLQRETALHPFQILPLDDETIINPTLIEKLRSQFDLTLDDGECDLDRPLTDILNMVRSAIKQRPEWSVTDDVYLSTFQFHKLSMYQDLERYADIAKAHPVIAALGDDRTLMPQMPDGIPTNAELDSKVAPTDIFHILDADDSQMVAIAKATSGANFIIQGPPGTGKSQTIANIIANFLAVGKKVLFVSEKSAALEVVQRRLKDRGLGDYCLELHSHRTNKREVIDELARVFMLEPEPTHHRGRSADLIQLVDLVDDRVRLNRYVEALHQLRPPLGLSCFDIHGMLASLAQIPHSNFTVPEVSHLTDANLSRFNALVMRLERVQDVVSRGPDHPWWNALPDVLSLSERAVLRTHLDQLSTLAQRIKDHGQRLAIALGLSAPNTIPEFQWLYDIARLAEEDRDALASWYQSPSLTPLIESANAQLLAAQHFQWRRAAILNRYAESIFDLDVARYYDFLSDPREVAFFEADPAAVFDRLIRDRPRITSTLSDLNDGINRIEQISTPLTALLGQTVPRNLREAKTLLEIAQLVANDAAPTQAWMSLDRYATIKARIADAAGQSRILHDHLPKLSASFDSSLITTASREFVDSYEQFSSGLRYVHPGYWKARSELRRRMIAPTKLTFEQELETLQHAHQVAEAQAWYAQHEPELAATFGRHYNGPVTDWDAITAKLDVVHQLLTLKQGVLEEGLTQLLLASEPSTINAASEFHQRLAEAVQATEQAFQALATIAPGAPLPDVEHDHDAIDLVSMCHWIHHLTDHLNLVWTAVDDVISCRRDTGVPLVADLLIDLQEIGILQELEEQAQFDQSALEEQFGRFIPNSVDSWQTILDALQWTDRIIRSFPDGSPCDSFVDIVTVPERVVALQPLIATADQLTQSLTRELQFLESLFAAGGLRVSGFPVDQASLDDLTFWAEDHLNRISELDDWMEYKRVEREIQETGLDDYFRAIKQENISPDLWKPVLNKRIFTCWLDHVYEHEPVLGQFRGIRHAEVIQQFRTLDLKQLDTAVTRIHANLAPMRPNFTVNGNGGEASILLREFRKKRRHKPLRRLFGELPTLLPALKPCLLMSPLSVSQFVPGDLHQFDLVIFDEASQIRPQDAVGAIMRGKQVIIVGDPKQLPPTAFFESAADDIEDDEESEQDSFESVLDACAARGMPLHLLKWHYRSRHEHLIAFSNHHFYENRLITFPSADQETPNLGVRLLHVPDGIYDRSKSRTNRNEAKQVAALVVKQLYNWPDRSLGVVTFSEAQMLAVLEELEILRRRDPSLESHFDDEKSEPLFVKNLEQVQGDERDTIIISVGYGRDPSGRLSMTFGPLNRAGGERRLNVAVTRAREEVIVVSSIIAADIDLTRSKSIGVALLKSYLDYARRGPIALAASDSSTHGHYESPFEVAVGEAIRAHGYEIHRQVGCSSYRIDLAVVDSDHPGRYIIGIECDGATYHSSKTARARDRLRQDVLERLGWRIHRIWSTDWIKDPEFELQRALAAIEKAKASTALIEMPRSIHDELTEVTVVELDEDVLTNDEVHPSPNRAESIDFSTGPSFDIPPYRPADLGDNSYHGTIMECPFELILDAVVECVNFEGTIHERLLATRVAASWNVQRIGRRIDLRLRAALQTATRSSLIKRRGEFLWPTSLTTVPPRGPSLDGEVRPISYVPIEEISEAARLCIQAGFSLPREELIISVTRMLGYERTGGQISIRINEAIETMISEHIAQSVGNNISLVQEFR